MILWLILFLLVVGISLILAYRSMKDYQELPQKSKVEYGLFLIRQLDNFDIKFLDSIRLLAMKQDLIISLERLFKGGQAVIAIFGPKIILDQFIDRLNLLELEDYAESLDCQEMGVWEMGVKDAGKFNPVNLNNIFVSLPMLDDGEQFFWQVVLGRNQTQIRAAFLTKDPHRKKILIPLLQSLGAGELVKIPKPFSAEQMVDFYRLRSLSKDSKGPVLDSFGIMRLLKI